MAGFLSTRSTGSNEAYPTAPAGDGRKKSDASNPENAAAPRPPIPGRPVRQKYLAVKGEAGAPNETPTTEPAAPKSENENETTAVAAESNEGSQPVAVSSDLVSMPAGSRPVGASASNASDRPAAEAATGTGRPVRKDRDPSGARRPTVRVHHNPAPPSATPTASLSPRVVVSPSDKPQTTSIQPPSPRIRHAALPPAAPVRTSPTKPIGGFTPNRSTMFLTREFSSLRISPSSRAATPPAASPAASDKPDTGRAGETETPAHGIVAPSSSAADVPPAATVAAQTPEVKRDIERSEVGEPTPALASTAPETATETTPAVAAEVPPESSIPSLVLSSPASSPAEATPEPVVAVSAIAKTDDTPAAAPAVETAEESVPATTAAVAPPEDTSFVPEPVAASSAAVASAEPVREAAASASTRQSEPTLGSSAAAAASLLAQVTFSFELFSLELTAGFRVAAIHARPSSETVSVLLGAESKNLMTLAATISFSVNSCRTSADGKLQGLTLVPLTHVVPPANPSLQLKVGATTLPASADSSRSGSSAPIAMAATEGSPQPVQVHASCRVVGIDFSPRFEIERIHLELESQSVYVQLDPASAHLNGNPPPSFTIASAQASANASPVVQLRLVPGARG